MSYVTIKTLSDLKSALRGKEYTDVGGYTLCFCIGGECFSFEGMRKRFKELAYDSIVLGMELDIILFSPETHAFDSGIYCEETSALIY